MQIFWRFNAAKWLMFMKKGKKKSSYVIMRLGRECPGAVIVVDGQGFREWNACDYRSCVFAVQIVKGRIAGENRRQWGCVIVMVAFCVWVTLRCSSASSNWFKKVLLMTTLCIFCTLRTFVIADSLERPHDLQVLKWSFYDHWMQGS